MTDKHKLWKLFFYAGVEKEEYNELLHGIRDENRVLLKVFSQIAAVIFFLLFIIITWSTTYFNKSFPDGQPGQVVCGNLPCPEQIILKIN